jgi:hypothetical protein
MSMFGFGTLPLDVNCDASLNFVNTDVMMVLDVTGSMFCMPEESGSCGRTSEVSGSRIVALRDAVMALYDELAPIQTQLEATVSAPRVHTQLRVPTQLSVDEAPRSAASTVCGAAASTTVALAGRAAANSEMVRARATVRARTRPVRRMVGRSMTAPSRAAPVLRASDRPERSVPRYHAA